MFGADNKKHLNWHKPYKLSFYKNTITVFKITLQRVGNTTWHELGSYIDVRSMY